MSAANFRLRLLGTGTSSGVPAIGCDCPTCTSDDPRDRRLRTSAAVQFTDHAGQSRTILIDVSPDHREQALRAGLNRCDGILLTHSHVDHAFGLDEVRRYNALMGTALDLYADEPTLQDIRRVFRHIFHSDQNQNDSFVARIVTRPIAPLQEFWIHGLRVLPLPLLHGRQEILGFRLEAPESGGPLPLGYCTDCSAIPPQSLAALAGVDTLILDMLRERSHQTHLTLGQAVELARSIGARRTVLVHMGHEVLHREVVAKLPAGIELGVDGMELSA